MLTTEPSPAIQDRPPEVADIHQRRRLKALLYRVGCDICRVSEISTLTVNDILRRTTVSRSTFYKYFSTKDAFFDFLAKEAEAGLSRSLSESTFGLGDPAARLCRSIEAYLLYCSVNLSEAAVILKLSEYRKSAPSFMARTLRTELQAGQEAGRFVISNLDVVHFTAVGAVNAMLVRILDADSPHAVEPLIRDALTSLLRMLHVPRADISRIAAD